MGRRVECFWSEPASVAEESLRRYASPIKPDRQCPGKYGYHDANVALGTVSLAPGERGGGADDIDHADSRWPTKCDFCDYVFAVDDEWQHNIDRCYQRTDNSTLFQLRNAPPGTMWDATWYPAKLGKGPDGRSLFVVLPDGEHWFVDGPAINGGGWTRTGDVPRITARPSILTPGYHGYLTDGFLED